MRQSAWVGADSYVELPNGKVGIPSLLIVDDPRNGPWSAPFAASMDHTWQP